MHPYEQNPTIGLIMSKLSSEKGIGASPVEQLLGCLNPTFQEPLNSVAPTIDTDSNQIEFINAVQD